MLHKKGKKEPGNVAHASVKKELAKPRSARSARIIELNLDTARILELSSTTMSRAVDKVISAPRPNRKRHKLQLTGPTTGIEISVLKYVN